MKPEIISRKQRELAQRDSLLLDSAGELLEGAGFSGLTLEKLATHTQFSKGTIYNHFISKEDLLTALCVRGLELQLGLYRRVLDFPGNRREKLLGMNYAYSLYAQRHPVLFMCSLSGLSPSVLEKSSPRRLQDRKEAETSLALILDSLIQEALAAGEIGSPLAQDAASISFAGWAMGFGTIALVNSAKQASSIQRLDTSPALLRNVSLILDGLQWQPMSNQWDYAATWRRLQDYFDEPAYNEAQDWKRQA